MQSNVVIYLCFRHCFTLVMRIYVCRRKHFVASMKQNVPYNQSMSRLVLLLEARGEERLVAAWTLDSLA